MTHSTPRAMINITRNLVVRRAFIYVRAERAKPKRPEGAKDGSPGQAKAARAERSPGSRGQNDFLFFPCDLPRKHSGEEEEYPSWIFDRRGTQLQRQRLATLRANVWQAPGGVAPQSQNASAMLFRRVLPAARQSVAHSFLFMR